MNRIEIIGLLLVALLFFVWPVPHTNSLRDLLLLSVFVLFGYLAYRQRPSGWMTTLRVPTLIYVVLSIWILVGAVLIAEETASSLNEIRGQWLKGFMALLAGAWVGGTIGRDDKGLARILTVLAMILAVHVLYVDFIAISRFAGEGAMAHRFEVFGGDGPDKSNYLTNTFLVFLFAEIFLRITHGQRTLRFGNPLLALLTLAALFSEYVTGMRNGIIEFTLVLLLLLILFVMENRWRMSRVMLMAGVALLLIIQVTLGYLSYLSDPRWKTFIETVPVAWDTETHKTWLNERKYGLPKLPDGRSVEGSAYQRIAAIKEGSRLAIEHPLGVGYSRNAYGHALEKKYGEVSMGHSHSGLVDFAIGAGMPGAFLWLGFLVSLVAMAWRDFRRTHGYPSLLLMLIIVGYGARMLVDSVIRDHMLQQFLFLVGLLAVIALVNPRRRAA